MISTPTPTPKRQLTDYWSLVLLIGASLLVWQAVDSDPADTAYVVFPWLTQRPACALLALAAVGLFIVIGRRQRRISGRWFSNASGGR